LSNLQGALLAEEGALAMWRVKTYMVFGTHGFNIGSGGKAYCRHGSPWFEECAWCREPEPLRWVDFWYREIEHGHRRPMSGAIFDWFITWKG
jgi:hypothetical protein